MVLIDCVMCGEKGLPSAWIIVKRDGTRYCVCTQCANNVAGSRDVNTLTITEQLWPTPQH
jgi:hypothetical protein